MTSEDRTGPAGGDRAGKNRHYFERPRRLPEKVVARVHSPVETFISTSSSSGIALIIAAAVALIWANSPWRDSYQMMKEIPFALHFGDFTLEKHLVEWVNELLMALFFFRVGLEIKREVLIGELSTREKAVVPAASALGGMVVPALIYLGFTWGGDGMRGWGIPMATDIAFAVGVLALLGDRVPLPAKIFILALAIVDDLGAILVIAVFYAQGLDVMALGIAFAVWLVAIFYGRARITNKLVYVILGLIMWYFMQASGVHATIAGVLMALAVPMRHGAGGEDLKRKADETLEHGDFEEVEERIEDLDDVIGREHSPLHRMERLLGPYVGFIVMPLFALFNAGVTIVGEDGTGLSLSNISLGVFFGLVVGKVLGTLGIAWLIIRAGFAQLPSSISWNTLAGLGTLAGIGFTMSLFIAQLAFGGDGELLAQAKIAILAASLFAAVLGLVYLSRATRSSRDLEQSSEPEKAAS